MQVAKNSRGGQRPNSGRKPKYKEATKTVAFRVPVSKIEAVKVAVKTIINSALQPD